MSQKQEGTRHEPDPFQLPENWQDGRERIHGLAIDSVENAIWMEQSDGIAKLHFSIPDVGLLEGLPVADARARRSEAERTAGLNPRKMLSERARKNLSLAAEDRPVIVAEIPLSGIDKGPKLFKGILRANVLSHESADKIMLWRGDPRAITLNGLMRYLKRENCTDGDPRFGQDLESPSRFIMAACRRIVDGSVAEFMDNNGIPGLYYDESGQISLGHIVDGDSEHPYFTAPLHRYASFVNASNVAAYLGSERLPYPVDRLDNSLTRLFYLERDRRSKMSKEEQLKKLKAADNKSDTENPEQQIDQEPVDAPAKRAVSKLESELLENGFWRLESLHKKSLIQLECDAIKLNEDDLLVQLRVILNGSTYEAEAQGECSRQIFNEAAATLIMSHDFSNGSLAAENHPNTDSVEELSNRYNPAYSFKYEEGGVVACTVTCKKRNVPQQVTRLSTSKAGSKASAARAMLRAMALEMPSRA